MLVPRLFIPHVLHLCLSLPQTTNHATNTSYTLLLIWRSWNQALVLCQFPVGVPISCSLLEHHGRRAKEYSFLIRHQNLQTAICCLTNLLVTSRLQSRTRTFISQ